MRPDSVSRNHPSIWLMLLFLSGSSLSGAGFKAGVGRMNITPELPVWLSGYAARTNPASVVLQDLWAKALALEAGRGQRVVIVTTDLIGLPPRVSQQVAARVQRQFGLKRAQLLLNSSHTHSGPAVWPNLPVMFDFNAQDEQRAIAYSKKLIDDLVTVVGAALQDLTPATLAVGHGAVGFAINRREAGQKAPRIGLNPAGPVDHDVPVVRVRSLDGKLRAILFAYACHNTTLGANLYQVNGDYAGFAQAELEKSHPGTMAMFLMLCGGDQNPAPRGRIELAMQHGRELAAAVENVLETELKPVGAPIRAAFQQTTLEFAPRARRVFEEEAKHPDRFRQRRARLMLAAYDAGHPIRRLAYPVQALRLNDDLVVVALGGEVVVDYDLRLKREYAGRNLVVAGYCNEVSCYIPSLRVLREGGYEPVDSMIYYGQPGPFQEIVEETIIRAVHAVLRRIGVVPRAGR